MARMINGFCLRRGLQTHPAGYASKLLFIRVIRAIRGFNFGSRVQVSSHTRLRLIQFRFQPGRRRPSRNTNSPTAVTPRHTYNVIFPGPFPLLFMSHKSCNVGYSSHEYGTTKTRKGQDKCREEGGYGDTPN
jgi:hypothetical protein